MTDLPSRELFDIVTARQPSTSWDDMRRRLEFLDDQSRRAALKPSGFSPAQDAGTFQGTVGGDPLNGGHWPLPCWIGWLRFDNAQVNDMRANYPPGVALLREALEPLRAPAVFAMTIWGDTDFCRDFANRVYAPLNIGIHRWGQPLPGAPGNPQNEVFLLHKGEHYDLLVYDPAAPADQVSLPGWAAYESTLKGLPAFQEPKEEAVGLGQAFDRYARRSFGSSCSKCGFGLKAFGKGAARKSCWCRYCETERRLKSGQESAEKAKDKAEAQPKVSTSGAAKCPYVAQLEALKKASSEKTTIVVRYRSPGEPEKIALDGGDQAKVGPINENVGTIPQITEHVRGTPISDLKPNQLPHHVIVLVPGGTKATPLDELPILAWREQAKVVHVVSTAVSFDDHSSMRELFEQVDTLLGVDRVVFSQPATAAAAALAAMKVQAVDFVKAGVQVTGQPVVREPKKREKPARQSETVADALEGLKHLRELNPVDMMAAQSTWFLRTAASEAHWLGWAIASTTIVPVPDFEYDLSELSVAALGKGGKVVWDVDKVRQYIDLVAVEGSLKPVTNAKSPRRICFDCLPERLAWVIWAILRSPAVIDSSCDDEVDSTTPSCAASMRSWHNDTPGNLPRPQQPSGDSMKAWLDACAQTHLGIEPEAATGKASKHKTASKVEVDDKPETKKTALYHAYITLHKGIQGKAKEDAAKKAKAVEVKGYIEFTGGCPPYPSKVASEGNGFFGYAIHAGGERLVYDYVNHRVFISPTHYGSEEYNPFILVEDVPYRPPFPNWPDWLVRRTLSGGTRQAELLVLRDRTAANSERDLKSLDDIYLRVLRRLAQVFFGDKGTIKPTKAAQMDEATLAGHFAGTGVVVTAYFPLAGQSEAPPPSSKSGKGAKKTPSRPPPKPKARNFPHFTIATAADVFGVIAALGANGVGPVEGAVLQWANSIGALSMTNMYFYPLQHNGVAVNLVHTQVDYPALRPQALVNANDALRAALSGVGATILGFTGAVANWMVENTRNHAQFPLLLLLSTLDPSVSPARLLADSELPVADGGWQNRTSWGLGPNPELEDVEGEPTASTARRRFGMLLQRFIDADAARRKEFERLALTIYITDEQLEAWLVETLRPIAEQALKTLLGVS